MRPRRWICRRLREEYVASREKLRGAFFASALAARQEVARNDRVMEAADVHRWLLARAAGGKVVRPRTIKLLK